MAITAQLGEETLEANEDSMIARIVELQRQLHDKSGPVIRRAQHPKHHGLVLGKLTVSPKLPAELQHGLFTQTEPMEIWLRFSNGKGDDDTRPTLHGLAMKVKGIELPGGPEQDFLMVDHPVFFIRNIAEYVALFEAQIAAKGGFPRQFFFPGINPFAWRLGSLARIRAVRKTTGNLLATRFFSTTPYRLGPHAIKFAMFPDTANGSNPSPGEDPNYLGNRLAEQLESKSARFRFMVQLQTNAESMPVEDPTVEWGAAWQDVATVDLEKQVTNSQERMQMAEEMVYTPWQTLEQHRPIGGINRARRVVYEALAKERGHG